MRYLTIKPEERAAITAFRQFCRHDAIVLVLRQRAIAVLKDIVEGKERVNVTEMQLASLLRRGLIRSTGKGFVATELGLFAMAFAVAGGLATQDAQDAEVVPMKRRKKGGE